MNNFDLFSLLIGMEQDWLKRKTPLDHLVALATFVNRTMKALEDECQENGLNLAPDTLLSILSREGLLGLDNYRFRIAQNRIDIDHFADLLPGSARELRQETLLAPLNRSTNSSPICYSRHW